MAISAAELPAMSSALGTQEEIGAVLRQRLENGLQEYFFFRSSFGGGVCWFLAMWSWPPYTGGTLRGHDVTFVWSVLAGSGVGLLASTSGRLYSSAFYALRDTRTPLNFAIIRVVLTVVMGYLFALPLPRLLGIDRRWGVAGLTLSAGMAGWVEFALLRRALQARIGTVVLPRFPVSHGCGLEHSVAAAVAYGVKLVLPFHRPELVGLCVLSTFGLGYLVVHQDAGGGSAG